MFYVYGVSIKDCRKQAYKKVNELFHLGKVEQDDFESEVAKLTNELFNKSKPKCISGQLSCPKRVGEFLELAKKDKTVRDLKPMKKVAKLDSGGNEVLTKKTKKPVFQIVQMSDLEL
jgi:hypothetical protein